LGFRKGRDLYRATADRASGAMLAHLGVVGRGGDPLLQALGVEVVGCMGERQKRGGEIRK
jgi:hypothetical protein